MVLPDRRHDQRESSEVLKAVQEASPHVRNALNLGEEEERSLVVAKINSAGGEGMTNDECRVPREIRSSKSEIRNKFLLNSAVSSSFLMSWPPTT